MQINTVPAAEGVRWLIEGFRLLRRQPLGLPAMTVVYLMLLLAPASLASSSWPAVALAGIVISGVVSPFATVGLMQCVRDAAAGRAPAPAAFAAPFKDTAARRHLLQLGLVNAALLVLVAGLAVLLTPEVPENTGPPSSVQDPRLMALLWQLLLYLPVLALMWFSPLLAGWHQMTPAKAMFGSAVASVRNVGPLLVYGIATALALGAISLAVVTVLGAFIKSPEAMSFIIAPVALAMTTVVQASFYPMYKSIFAEQAGADQSVTAA